MNRIKLKNLMYFTRITLSIFLLSSSPTLSASNQTAGSCEIFKNSQHEELYWRALIHAAHNRTDQAKAITKALNENNTNTLKMLQNSKKKSSSIDDLFDKIFLSYIARRPQELTDWGFFESIEIRHQNNFLDDISPEQMKKELVEIKENLLELNSWSLNQLTPGEQTSFKVFQWNLQTRIKGERFIFHEYFINQMIGTLFCLDFTLLQYHPLNIIKDFETFIIRLAAIPQQFKQLIKLIEYQTEIGITYPNFTLDYVISSLKKSVTTDIEQNKFYKRLVENKSKLEKPVRKNLMNRAKMILENSVYPAYKELLDYISTMPSQAKSNHGVWALPNGDEYYAYKLKESTTLENLSANQIHNMGLEEVARIQKELRSLLAEEGYNNPNKSIGELIQELALNPIFYFAETNKGRQECIKEFKAILKRSRKDLYPLFNIRPAKKVKIMRMPISNEAGSPGAFYASPSIDGSRPGIFYINLRKMKELPRFKMETLAVHEAEPGHHFQCSIQSALDIPPMRKIGHYTAYTEGWALYTEKLAYENNFYSSPASKIGHLQDELLRAIRLVIDTGIHKKRWSREFAVDYMVNETGFTRESVITEVERYFILPGQSCAYKIGQLKILELRKKAQEALGNKFDIRQFHDVILSVGCVPLTVLEDAIEKFIETKVEAK